MKKIAIFTLLISLCSLICGQEVIIKNIDPPKKLNGSKYFPLFVGAKWIWDVKGMGNITKINWEIISAHKINDIKNNIEETTAYKLKMSFKIEEKEISDEWYVFEYEGFICFYRKSSNDYRIEKIIPVNPIIDTKWTNSNTTYRVVKRQDNTVKVESVNEEIDKYGYQMFIKDVGPYEIFEYFSSGEKREDTMMTLVDNIAYEDIHEPADEEKEVVMEEPKKTETVASEMKDSDNNDAEEKKESVKVDDSLINITEDDYINSLSNDKEYLQIGAFNIIYYAEDLVRKVKRLGYHAKIFQDIDGFYKVLIEVSSEEDIKDIKAKVTKDAFLKK